MTFWKPGTIAPGEETKRISSSSTSAGSSIPLYASSQLDRDVENEGGSSFVYNPNRNLSLQQQRLRLPVYHHRLELMYLLERHRVLIVVGETGCGKTTQIPQYLHECGWTRGGRSVCVTQPRRVAATSVAKRVAEEMGVTLGQEVGYAIRFDDKSDVELTRIKFVTDGMLLRETMLDPLLSRYSVVMLDEAHERSLHTDLLAGLLKKIMRRRSDLRLIVSSATIDAEVMKAFFDDKSIAPVSMTSASSMATPPIMAPTVVGSGNSMTSNFTGFVTISGGQQQQLASFLKPSTAATPTTTIPSNNNTTTAPTSPAIISIEGRLHPVDVLYSAKPVSNYVEAALQTVLDIHKFEAPGDVLVFLTGQEEIESFIQILNERADDPQLRSASLRLRALPIYAGLPWERQAAVFEAPAPRTRKVVVATNIAETSITIDGIAYVVDCGFVKVRVFNARLGIEQLVVVPISQAAAKQRAGRAGRNRPGKAFRLYTEETLEKLLAPSQTPEIQRVNLNGVLLQLKALGIDNILAFDFLSKPPVESVVRALEVSKEKRKKKKRESLTSPSIPLYQ
jgi:ATP-dependent RNA helicase DDX35